MADFNIYDDLELLHAQEKQKAVEDLQWKDKYQVALGTIEKLQADKKELNKKIKQLEVNFASLLDTARTEIKRKDNQIAQLRREKDDICFRRDERSVNKHSVEYSVGDGIMSDGIRFNPFALEPQIIVPKSIKTVDRTVNAKSKASSSRQRDGEDDRRSSRTKYREPLPRRDRERDRSSDRSRDKFGSRSERNSDRKHSRCDRELSQNGSSDSSREKNHKGHDRHSYRINHKKEKHLSGTINGYASSKQENHPKDKRDSRKEPKNDERKESKTENGRPNDGDKVKADSIENKENTDNQKIAALEDEILNDVKQFKKMKLIEEKEPKPVEDPIKAATEKSNQFLDALFDDMMLNDEDDSNDLFKDLKGTQSVDTCFGVESLTEKEEVITKTDENCNVELQLRTPLKKSVTKLFEDLFGPSPAVTASTVRRNSVSSVGESSSDTVNFTPITAEAKTVKPLNSPKKKEITQISTAKTFVVADLTIDDSSSESDDGGKTKKKLAEVKTISHTAPSSKTTPAANSAEPFKFTELDSSFYSSEEEDDNEKEIVIQSQSDIESPPFEDCAVSIVSAENDVNRIESSGSKLTFSEHTEKNHTLKSNKSNSEGSANTLQNGEREHRADIGSKNDKTTEGVKNSEDKDGVTSTMKHDVKKDQSHRLPDPEKQKESQTSRHTSENNEKKKENTRKDSSQRQYYSSKHHKSSSSSRSRSSSRKDSHRFERFRSEEKRHHHHHHLTKESTKSKHDRRGNEKSETEKNSSSHRSSQSSRKYSKDSRHHSSREVKDKITVGASKEKRDISADSCSSRLIWSDANEEHSTSTMKRLSSQEDNSSDLKLYQDQVISLHCDDISDEEDGEVIAEDEDKQKASDIGLDEISEDDEEVEVVMGELPTKIKQQTNDESLDVISDEEEVDVIMGVSLTQDKHPEKLDLNIEDMEKLQIEDKTALEPQNLLNQKPADCNVEAPKSKNDAEEEAVNTNREMESSKEGAPECTLEELSESANCVNVKPNNEDEPLPEPRHVEEVETNGDMDSDCLLIEGVVEEPTSSTTDAKLKSSEDEERSSVCLDESQSIKSRADKKAQEYEKADKSATDVEEPNAKHKLSEYVPAVLESMQATKLTDSSTDVAEFKVGTKLKLSDKTEEGVLPDYVPAVEPMESTKPTKSSTDVPPIEEPSTNYDEVQLNEKEEKSPGCIPALIKPMESTELSEPSIDVSLVEEICTNDEPIESKEQEEKSPDYVTEALQPIKSPKLTDPSIHVPESTKSEIDEKAEFIEKVQMSFGSVATVANIEEPFKPKNVEQSKEKSPDCVPTRKEFQKNSSTNEQVACFLIGSPEILSKKFKSLSPENNKTITEQHSVSTAVVHVAEQNKEKLPEEPQLAQRKAETVSSGRRRKLKTPRKCTGEGKLLKDSFTIMATASSRYAKSDDERSSILNKQPQPPSLQLRRTKSSSNLVFIDDASDAQIQIPAEEVTNLASVNSEADVQPQIPIDEGGTDTLKVVISPEGAKDLISPLAYTKIQSSDAPPTSLVKGGASGEVEQQEMPVLWMEEESRETPSVVKASTTICELNSEEKKSETTPKNSVNTETSEQESNFQEKQTEMSSKYSASHSNEEQRGKLNTPRKGGILEEGTVSNVETVITSVSKKRKREKILQNFTDNEDKTALVTTGGNKIYHKKTILQHSIASGGKDYALPCFKDSKAADDNEKMHRNVAQCTIDPNSLMVASSDSRNRHELPATAFAVASVIELDSVATNKKCLLTSTVSDVKDSVAPKSIVTSDSKKKRHRVVDNTFATSSGGDMDTVPLSEKNLENSLGSHIKCSVVPESIMTSGNKKKHRDKIIVDTAIVASSDIDVDSVVTSETSLENVKNSASLSSSSIYVKNSVVSRPEESIATCNNKRKYKKRILQNFIDSDTALVASSDTQNQYKAKSLRNSSGCDDEDEPLFTASNSRQIHHKKRILQKSTAEDSATTDDSKTSTSGNKKRQTPVVATSSVKDQYKAKSSQNSPCSDVRDSVLPEPVTTSGNKKKRNSNTSQNSTDSDVKDASVVGRGDNKSLRKEIPQNPSDFDANNSVLSDYAKIVATSHTNRKYKKRILQHFNCSNIIDNAAVDTNNEKILQLPSGSHVTDPIAVVTSDNKTKHKKKALQHSPGSATNVHSDVQAPTTSHINKKQRTILQNGTNSELNHSTDLDDILQKSTAPCLTKSLAISLTKLKSPTKPRASTSTPDLEEINHQGNNLQATTDSIDNPVQKQTLIKSKKPSTSSQSPLKTPITVETSLPCPVKVKSSEKSNSQHIEPESITSSTTNPNGSSLNESLSNDEKERSAIYVKRKMKPTKQPRERRKVRKLSSSSSDTVDEPTKHQSPPTSDCDKPLPPISKPEKKQRTTLKRKRSSSHDKSLPSTSAATPTHHKIFNDDVFPEDQQATLPPVYNVNEDDVQYQEIDNRMRSIFQSPTYSHTNGGCSFELANGSAVELQDDNLKDNLTVDETLNQSEKSLCDTSTSSRKISVGSNDYVIETVGAHTANVFITRKKCKKRMKIAVATA